MSRLRFSPLPVDMLLDQWHHLRHQQDDSLSWSRWALCSVLNCLPHISTWCLQLSTSLPSSTLISLFLSQSPISVPSSTAQQVDQSKKQKDSPYCNIQFIGNQTASFLLSISSASSLVPATMFLTSADLQIPQFLFLSSWYINFIAASYCCLVDK